MRGVKFISMLIIVTLFMFSCGPSAQEVYDQQVIADSIAKVVQIQHIANVKVFSATNTDLIPGKVMAKESSQERGLADNYITVRNANGVCEIFRDVDEDVYLNLEVGDSLQ